MHRNTRSSETGTKEQQVLKKISFALPHDMYRVHVSDSGGTLTVTLNTHEMKTGSAKSAIENIIKLLRAMPFTLKIIHGYNNGVATRDMIWYQIWPEFKERVKNVTMDPCNQGLSICTIA